MKILTLVSILQTAAIFLLLYEAYAPGTIAGLAPASLNLGPSIHLGSRSPTPISRREFQLMIRDEMARVLEATPSKGTQAKSDAPTTLILRTETQPNDPGSPFRSQDDVEALMEVSVKLDSIAAGETLSEDEFKQLEKAIGRLHQDDRAEMLSKLVRAITQTEAKPQDSD